MGPVRLKSPRDPVTRADGASERAIRRLLHRRFPTIGFLGEEGGTVATGPDGRWIVDPLDGTIAFVAGLPTFGVSIALERRGRLEVGVMLFPPAAGAVRRRARPGRLAERAADPGVAHGQDGSVRRLALARGRPVAGPRMRERLARLGGRGSERRHVRACFSLAYVAAGRLDAYWERQAPTWDVAAGALSSARRAGA